MKVNTVELVSQFNCIGCMMCGDVCGTGGITFLISDDGFWYPSIDKNKCVNCGLCYKKCPAINDNNNNKEIVACYGAKTKDEDIRIQSTSGGFFTELAYEWICSGGMIFGAEYDENNQVFHCGEDNIDGIDKLRQSKYVQSNLKGVYKAVKSELRKGKSVMFCGAPCQIEALHLFLGNDYDNLLTLDFVCCGICSPFVYNEYIYWLENKYRSKVKRVWFKNKREGWGCIGTEIEFENGKKYFRTGNRDPYMTSFVTDALCMRSSCEKCKYRKLPHISDIMLGDFWGIDKIKPGFNDDRGISAIIINSKKGQEWFDQIKERMDFFETNANEISQGNFTIYKAKVANPNRLEFIDAIKTESFEKAIKKYSSYSGTRKLKIDIKYYLGRVKRSLRKFMR